MSDVVTVDLSTLDQVQTLAELDAWTKNCTACSLRNESHQVTFATGSHTSPVMLVGMNPAFCEDGTGTPFCGAEELRQSRCPSCVHFHRCYDWYMGQAPAPTVKQCLGFTPNPPGTPPGEVPTNLSINGARLGGLKTAGQLLDDALQALGVDRRQLFLTNVALCKSEGREEPKPQHVIACTPIRLKAQRLLRPKVIVPLGLLATAQYTGKSLRMRDVHGTLLTWRDSEGWEAKVVPTYHPASILRKILALSQVDPQTHQAMRADIIAEKWALYEDLGRALNLLPPEQLQPLLLPGTTLDAAGKLPLKVQS